MLMDLPTLIAKYDMRIKGVLHVGAHLAEECLIYEAVGAGPVTWIEANPAVIPKITRALHKLPNQRVVQALIWSESGRWLPFNVTNYDGMSSSVLEFGTHTQFSPDTVFVDKLTLLTSTIDDLVDAFDVHANFLSMDLQGAEYHALLGAGRFLLGVDYIMSEVNQAEVYIGCAQVEQLDQLLGEFERVATHWVADQGWGDALWVRR